MRGFSVSLPSTSRDDPPKEKVTWSPPEIGNESDRRASHIGSFRKQQRSARPQEISLFEILEGIELPSIESSFNELQSAFMLVGTGSKTKKSNEGLASPKSVKIGTSRKLNENETFQRSYEEFLNEANKFLVNRCNGSWAHLFYLRMVAEENVLTREKFNLILAKAQKYATISTTTNVSGLRDSMNASSENLLNLTESPSKINRSLLQFLQTHSIDPDNSLIGLSPSRAILKGLENQFIGKGGEEVSYTKEELINIILQLSEIKEDRVVAEKLRKTASSIREQKGHSTKKNSFKKGDLFIVMRDKNKTFSEIESIVGDQHGTDAHKVNGEDAHYVIGRYWGESHNDLLHFYVSPTEDKALKVPRSHAIPISEEILKGAMFEVKRMEKLVMDPSAHLYDSIHEEIKSICSNWIVKNCSIPSVAMLEGWAKNVVSLSNLRDLKRVKKSLEEASEEIPAEILSQSKACIREKLEDFFTHIDQQSFFIPRKMHCMSQLGLFQADFVHNVKSRIQRYLSVCDISLEQLNDQIKKILSGSTKAELTNWWLTLIKTRVDGFLKAYGYDHEAVSTDYTTTPPQSMSAVKKNIQILQRVLKSFNALRMPDLKNDDKDFQTEVDTLIKDLLGQIYPVLEDYVETVKMVLRDHFDIDPSVPFDIKNVQSMMKEQKAEMDEEAFRKLDGIISDIFYIEKMKTLEDSPKVESKDIVPVTGLIMGRFIRFENEAETVVEMWDSRRDSVLDDVI